MKKVPEELRKIAAGVMAVEKRTKEDDYQTCIHEAAHVVAGWRLPYSDTPHFVSVNPDPDHMSRGWMNDGSTIPTRALVRSALKMEESESNLAILKARGIKPRTREERLAFGKKLVEDKVVVALAGPAADMMMGTDFINGDGEIYVGLTICYRNHYEDDDLFGWREQLRELLNFDEDGDWGHAMKNLFAYEANRRRREDWMLLVWCRAIQFVIKNWKEIERLAKVLQKKRTLDRAGMFKVLEKRGTDERRSA